MGMFIHVDRIKPPGDELVDVRIIVDGKNYPFSLKEIRLEPTSRTERWEFIALVRALSASKQKSFVVEYPKYKTAETFSLLDARKTLRGGKILEGCDHDS